MQIFTKWVCYNGAIGITENGEYYELETGKIMKREVHAGALYYRCTSSNKRYSWSKCNSAKELKRIEINICPF